MAKDTRERLEATALRLFCERGIAEVSVRDLASAMNTRESSLYRHMASKDELVERVFGAAYEALAVRFQEACCGRIGLRERLEAIVNEAFKAYDQERELISFMLLRQHEMLPRLKPGLDTPAKLIAAYCLEGQRDLRMGADLAATLIYGMIMQPMVSIHYGILPGPAVPYAPAVTDAILHAVGRIDA